MAPCMVLQQHQCGAYCTPSGSFGLQRLPWSKVPFVSLSRDKLLPAWWFYLDLSQQYYCHIYHDCRWSLGTGFGFGGHHCHGTNLLPSPNPPSPPRRYPVLSIPPYSECLKPPTHPLPEASRGCWCLELPACILWQQPACMLW